MATFNFKYNPPGVMGAGKLPSFGSGSSPFPTFKPWTGLGTTPKIPVSALSPIVTPNLPSPLYSTGTTPGITSTPSAGLPPDYVNLINSLMGQVNFSGTVDPLQGIPLAQRAVIQYGEVPSNFQGLNLGNLGKAFDSGTGKLAAANTASGISLVARLKQADLDRQRQIKNSLAAHGILQSGETGFQYGREQTDYARARADSLGKLLDYLSGINQGIAGYLAQQKLLAQLKALLSGGGSSGGGGDYPLGTPQNPFPQPDPVAYPPYQPPPQVPQPPYLHPGQPNVPF